MSGTQQSFNDVVVDFNLSARTEFNKQYQELEPELKGLAFRFNAGNVAQSNFYINQLFSTVKEWKGAQSYKKIDEVIKTSIVHTEYEVEGLEIPSREFKRAASVNSITGMDMYIKAIGAQAPAAKDAPYEKMLDLLEAGNASTYGTTFDNQNMFDTTHAFDKEAGTQSNLLTGTGISTAQLSADLKSAIAALNGFYLSVDNGSTANNKKRKLNKGKMKLVVVCDSSLSSAFSDLNSLENIVIDTNGGSQTNTLRNKFEVVDRPFTDANNWYLMEVSDAALKPFMISVEDEGALNTPDDQPEAIANLQVLRYAFNGLSYGVGYGAWWKAILVNNS
jgi:hypothetical protein